MRIKLGPKPQRAWRRRIRSEVRRSLLLEALRRGLAVQHRRDRESRRKV